MPLCRHAQRLFQEHRCVKSSCSRVAPCSRSGSRTQRWPRFPSGNLSAEAPGRASASGLFLGLSGAGPNRPPQTARDRALTGAWASGHGARGDVVRTHLSKGLRFGKQDRDPTSAILALWPPKSCVTVGW